ncbi:MAG TPA: hotdog domain-containing protein [Burkholderiales bacterium]|nr:hotdog domain-containing protein [Burkholderiales bacterium]
MDLSRLKPGLRGQCKIVVESEHTAPHVGSGVVPVLATPVMINMFEASALAAVEGLLPEGYQTVGITLDVRHFAATPVGMEAFAEAELVSIDNRTLRFKVAARDEHEPIGDGFHERVIITLGRFDQRMADKLETVKGKGRLNLKMPHVKATSG